MDNAQLRQLQLLELNIALEFKRVCDMLNIKYFLIGGTLLGAVRHEGFIPWDDDMDVGMMREDYDRFMKEAPAVLDKKFFLQNWNSDSDYPYSFAKLRLNGTTVVEKMNVGTNSHKGVFLDIFPFDNVPADKKKQRKQARYEFWLKKLLWIKKGYGKELKKDSLKLRLKYYCGKFLSLFCSYDKLKNKFETELTRYNNEKSDYMFCSCLYSYEKSMAKREWLENLALYKFEDQYFSSVKDYDAFLKHQYGDYMKLPPEDQRHTHEIQELKIDFNLGDEI